MKNTKIKICGITTPEQAAEIDGLGADMIGLVFAKSPRQISTEQAIEICPVIQRAKTVGVFVDASASEINEIAKATGLDIAQLHGHESAEIVDQISIPCIKAFPVSGPTFIEDIRQWINQCNKRRPEAILLDTYSADVAGGTGKTFNWDLLTRAGLDGLLQDLPPIILAGGLGPENICDAVTTVKPYGVDCSSGVELTKGIKDIEKVKTLINNIRNL